MASPNKAETERLIALADERGYTIERIAEYRGQKNCFVAVCRATGERLIPSYPMNNCMRIVDVHRVTGGAVWK